MLEIDVTYEEVLTWDKSSYLWIDIRDEGSIAYGGIPDAKWIAEADIDNRKEELPKDKKLVFYCMRGIVSIEVAQMLRKEGYDAYSLQDIISILP